MQHPASLTESELRRSAKKRVDLKMGFLTHLAVYLLVNGVFGLLAGDGFAVLGRLGSGQGAFLPIHGWTLGLAVHGVVTLLSLSGGNLREQLMQRELEALRRRAP
jgi:hypothetical protein